MGVAIEVRNLWFCYEEGRYVLRGVSLDIYEGEIVAIMGENGAGKTTLVKHFNGLLKPVKGYVKVFGMDTRERTVAELARYVGLIFQNPQHQLFLPTVEEELRFGPRNLGFSEDVISRRVEELLKKFDLEKYRRHDPLKLSGGEKRRVAIASILAMDPKIIVFDEPTVGQDMKRKREFGELIRRLRDEGRTVVVVTHDVDFAYEYTDRVVLLSRGIVICEGPSKEVLSNIAYIHKARLALPVKVQLLYEIRRRLGIEVNVLDADKALVEVVKEVVSCPTSTR